MKNKLSMMLILVLAVFCICVPAKASSINVVLGFNPSSQQVPLGSSFSVDLTIAGLGNGAAPALGVFDIDISYNPAVISLNSVAYGTSLDLGQGSFQITTPGSGTVNVYEVSYVLPADLNTLQPSAFTLAQFTFTALSLGTSPLKIDKFTLGDANGDPLLALANNGSANVVPLPPALLLFAPGLAGLIGIKKKYLG
jgi:hypothetical protein